MEPKFQSSFIPKGPIVSATTTAPMGQKIKGKKSLLAFLATIIFTLSVLAAVGAYGYELYLKYRINKMSVDLEKARAALQLEVIRELIRLDDRIVSTEELISKHQILSPLFEFLETTTPKTVRFSDFQYLVTEQGPELHMRGEARGYTALAFQADVFNKSQYFKNPVFSDISLSERGDVTFSLTTTIDPSLVSYQKEVERIGAPAILPSAVGEPAASEAATSTTATSTPN